ncbi:serine hydrolase domain-containing protein [Lysobacter tyrosinilyticus]
MSRLMKTRKFALHASLALGLVFALTSLASRADEATATGLAEFEGHYAYRDGQLLDMVASGDTLVAIIGEGKYPLLRVGPDLFKNGSGDAIPFLRDKAGRITAFKENEQAYARLSGAIPDATRQLLQPRPNGGDGKPATYHYQPPPSLGDGIATGRATTHTLPPTAAEQLVQGVLDGRYADVHSILIYRGDRLLLEEYFYGYDRQRPHQMRSLTKSVVALLAGIATGQGRMRADSPVLQGLGEVSPLNPDPRKAQITLKQLLSHSSGLACNDHDSTSPGNEVALYDKPDWIKAFIDLPMIDDPGHAGRYCSGGILAAGRMVERAARTPLPDFAQAHLFAPLGIARDSWQWNFTLDRSQRNEFGQIYLRPRDMLKLGLLIRQHGQWQGKDVVPAAWTDAMTARQSHVDDSDYGLGVWHRWYAVATPTGTEKVDTIMFSGNGGQKVYVVPSLDLVAVFTGGAFNQDSPVNTMMAKVLLPALLEPASQPGK